MRRILAIMLVALLALAAGCVRPTANEKAEAGAGTKTAKGTASGGTSSKPQEAIAVVPSGSVHTPDVGSPERQALMDAARAYLKLPASEKFVVRQLKSDGAWAIGEQERAGKTTFFAYRNAVKGGWAVIWSGAADGGKGAKAADVRFSPDVIAAIDWTGRPSESEMVEAAKRLATESGAILVQGAKFGDATQDSQGRWWAEVDILNELDGAIVIIYRDGGVWKMHDAGTGIEPGDLPPDVKLDF